MSAIYDKPIGEAATESIEGAFTSLYNAEYLTQTLEENKNKVGVLM